MSVIIKLLSKFDDSGLRKAKSGFGGLGKALGAVGIGIGINQIASELSTAVKNAQEDVISQKQLARQLKITAGATNAQVAAQEDYITKLSMTTGVVDDKLRPSFSVLLRATGSVKKAQELLNVSLDTSAGTGKDLEIVTKSIARAYGGNITGLQKLVPGIKKGSDAMGFLTKNFKGARETLANPFDKLQIAIDETKEKIGMILLPYVQKFATYMIEKVVPVVDKFLDDVSNPKTEVGKAFRDIKKAVEETIAGVKQFFEFFGDGDAVQGFANIATSLIKMLPALLALKAIMTLASAGKAIQSLVTAMTLIQGKSAASGVDAVSNVNPLLKVAAASQVATLAASTIAEEGINKDLAKTGQRVNIVAATFTGNMAIPYDPSNPFILGGKRAVPNATTVNINVTNADPKATVDAWVKWAKQNGGVPNYLKPRG